MIPSPPTQAWGLLAWPWMGPGLVSVQMSAGVEHAGSSLLTGVWAPVASLLAQSTGRRCAHLKPRTLLSLDSTTSPHPSRSPCALTS